MGENSNVLNHTSVHGLLKRRVLTSKVLQVVLSAAFALLAHQVLRVVGGGGQRRAGRARRSRHAGMCQSLVTNGVVIRPQR